MGSISDEDGYQGFEKDLFGDDDNVSIRSSDDETKNRSKGGPESQEASPTQQNEKSNDAKKQVKPKRLGPTKHVLLDEDTLCGKNGLIKIEKIFKDFKFNGKGREQQDLDRVLHKLDHWVHVMHPRFPFDQSLERIEFLGAKKPRVKTYVKKIRMGLVSYQDKTDDFFNLENVLSSDDNGDSNIPMTHHEETTKIPAESHFNTIRTEDQSIDDAFADAFPDLPEELFDDEGNFGNSND